MQRKDGIGKDWANKILANGYEADNRNPTTTKAKIWNNKNWMLEEVELNLGLTKANYKSVRWNGRKIVK